MNARGHSDREFQQKKFFVDNHFLPPNVSPMTPGQTKPACVDISDDLIARRTDFQKGDRIISGQGTQRVVTIDTGDDVVVWQSKKTSDTPTSYSVERTQLPKRAFLSALQKRNANRELDETGYRDVTAYRGDDLMEHIVAHNLKQLSGTKLTEALSHSKQETGTEGVHHLNAFTDGDGAILMLGDNYGVSMSPKVGSTTGIAYQMKLKVMEPFGTDPNWSINLESVVTFDGVQRQIPITAVMRMDESVRRFSNPDKL